MIKLKAKEGLDPGIALYHKELKLLFNLGPFPGGGDCIIIENDGRVDFTNSNNIIENATIYNSLDEPILLEKYIYTKH